MNRPSHVIMLGERGRVMRLNFSFFMRRRARPEDKATIDLERNVSFVPHLNTYTILKIKGAALIQKIIDTRHE